MAMLDDKPVMKERLMAIGAFAGIGLFAVTAVDLMVTGGFDFGPGRAPYDREQPSAYVRMVDAADYVGDSFRSIGWNDFFLRPPDTSESEERLAGADDGTMPPDLLVETGEASGDELYREIAALYERTEAYVEEPSYEDAPAIDADEPYAQEGRQDEAYEEPIHEDEYGGDGGKEEASAYETESPW